MAASLSRWLKESARNWLRRGCKARGARRALERRLLIEPVEPRRLMTHITFDYRYDTDKFFDNQDRREILEMAGAAISEMVTDHLDPIRASGDNYWIPKITHPGTGEKVDGPSNLHVGRDEIIVFAGGGGSNGHLALGGTGGSYAHGDEAWRSLVARRGSVSLFGDDNFVCWGGSISFDPGENWHFGKTTAGLERDEVDFYSVALHELGHVLGLFRSDAAESYIRDHRFTDTGLYHNVVDAYGGPVPMDGDDGHWAEGTRSDGREAAMDPTITVGERKTYTTLDWAALDDVGWSVRRYGSYGEPGGVLTIRVCDAAGNPVSGMRLSGERSYDVGGIVCSDAVLYLTPTDSRGVLTVFAGEGGTWDMRLSGHGHVLTKTIDIVDDDVNYWSVRLPDGFSLTDSSTSVDEESTLFVAGDAGSSDDQITIRRQGASLVVDVNGTVDMYALQSIARIRVDTGAGADTLTIDCSGGNPLPAEGLSFDDNTQGEKEDRLVVRGGTFHAASLNSGDNGSGHLILDGSSIRFDDLASVTLDTSITDLRVDVTDIDAQVTLRDESSGTRGVSRLEFGDSGHHLTFVNPTSVLTIGTSLGDDRLCLAQLDPQFEARLKVVAAQGNDTLVLEEISASVAELQFVGGPGRDQVRYTKDARFEIDGASLSVGGLPVDMSSVEEYYLRGAFVDRSVHPGQIVLPQFDSELGTLTRAEVAVSLYPSYAVGGTREIALHGHAFGFDVGPFHFDATALPDVSGHGVSGAFSQQTFQGDDLRQFLAAQPTFDVPHPVVSTPWNGHTHELSPGLTFQVDTVFYYDMPPDLFGGKLALTGGSIAPGSVVDLEFEVGNGGSSDSDAFEVGFYLSRDGEISASDYLLGSYRLDGAAKGAGSGAQSTSLAIPPADDPFWDQDGDYTIGMIVDAGNEIHETDESNNRNLGSGLDRFTRHVDLPEPGQAIDLGPLSWVTLRHLAPAGGDLWYRIETTRRGPVTAYAIANGDESVRLTLYDGEYVRLDRSVSSDSDAAARVDHNAEVGEVFFVRLSGEASEVELKLANCVIFDNGRITAVGTDEDDAFAIVCPPSTPFLVGQVTFAVEGDLVPVTNLRLVINGIGYGLPGVGDRPITFAGRGGNDTFILNSLADVSGEGLLIAFDGGSGENAAVLWGSGEQETAVLKPGSGVFYGPRFDVSVANVSRIDVHGLGGGDELELHDSPGDDVLEAHPTTARLEGPGFSIGGDGFASIVAVATNGEDVASLYDSAEDDRYVAGPVEATLAGATYSLRTTRFDVAHAYALYGGKDTAEFHDSAGQDYFVGRPEFSWIKGPGFFRRAKFFDEVYAHSEGGDDTAEFRDSPGAEQFIASPSEGTMIGQGFLYHAEGFRYLHGYGICGGYDTASLTGTPGNDRFQAAANNVVNNHHVPFSCLTDDNTYFVRAKKMDVVVAYSGGGYDLAVFKDSPGDDGLATYAAENYAKFYGPGHYSRVHGFSEINGLAHYFRGDRDIAQLHDSTGDDTFTGTPTMSTLEGPGYRHMTYLFDCVYAYGDEGRDTACLYDSAGNDTFVGTPKHSFIQGTDFFCRVESFETVCAEATQGGSDTAELYDCALENLLEAGERDGQTWARLSTRNAVQDYSYTVLAFDSVLAHTGSEDSSSPELPPPWLTIDRS